METEKLNDLVKNNPNKLYNLLASSRYAKDYRIRLADTRYGRYGRHLYEHNPKHEFIAENVMKDIEKESFNNIQKREYQERMNKKHESLYLIFFAEVNVWNIYSNIIYI